MDHGSRRAGKAALGDRSVLVFAVMAMEDLEGRCLLSASVKSVGKAVKPPVMHPIAQPHYNKNRTTTRKNSAGKIVASYAGSSTAFGKTPTQVRNAYGLGTYLSSPITFNGIQGDGTGQTIAIVDAYDFPTAFNDLNAFSNYFGLPTLTSNTTSLANINSSSGPTFTKVNQSGSLATASLPGTDPAGPYWSTQGSTWEQEAALDIEWAHVMAPKANIVLVEANDANNLIPSAINEARSISGVGVVSMSFGAYEDQISGETGFDGTFTTASGHLGGAATAGGSLIAGGITFLASTGDSGAYTGGTNNLMPEYPATSPNVVAVGGTNLQSSGNTYTSESAWGNGTASGTTAGQQGGGGGGGGISTQETQPSYQSSTVSAFSTTKRTTPDLSVLADPATGVPIYDSWDFENPNDGTTGVNFTPWVPGTEGGTSLACPLMAGIVAVADQGRAINGIGSLFGNQAGSGTTAGTLQNIYSISSSDYHDITTGSNGYSAAAGYDLATGRGSPIAGTFIKDVAAIPTATTGTITGTIFRDSNANGTQDGGETAITTGVSVYFDANNNGVKDATELSATSNGSGVYTISGVTPASGVIRLVSAVTGYVGVTTPGATVTAGNTSTANFGLFPTAYTDATNSDAWTLRINPSISTQTQILINGVVSYSATTTLFNTMSFSFSGTNDSLTVDNTNGAPVNGLVTFAGTSAANDTLSVIGTSGIDTFSISSTAVVLTSRSINYTNAATVSVDPKGGTDALTVSSGTVHIPAQTASGGILSRTFSTLSVAAGAKLLADSAGSRNDRTVYVATSAGALSITGTGQFDLGANDLIVKGGSLATVNGLASTGYNAGAWTGNGLASSAAAANSSKNTALGVLLNGSLYTLFDNVSVATTDVLVRYTAYGDTNLDGTVNFTDFLALQSSFGATTTGFGGGNFNYDTKTDFTDFLSLQANFGLVV